MPESFERESEKDYNGPANAEGKAVYGKRNPNSVIEARQRRLYKHQQSGLTPRALVYEHCERESISLSTGWKDWEVVKTWNTEDFSSDRDTLVARLSSMRFRAIQMALKKGQLQTAAHLMDSLGRAVGEGLEVEQAQHAPQLNISIEAPGANTKKPPEDSEG